MVSRKQIAETSHQPIGALTTPSALSGRQPFTNPGFALQAIVEAVMQATWPSLPELDAFGQQTVATPMRRAMWRLVEETFFGFREQILQLGAITNHLALR